MRWGNKIAQSSILNWRRHKQTNRRQNSSVQRCSYCLSCLRCGSGRSSSSSSQAMSSLAEQRRKYRPLLVLLHLLLIHLRSASFSSCFFSSSSSFSNSFSNILQALISIQTNRVSDLNDVSNAEKCAVRRTLCVVFCKKCENVCVVVHIWADVLLLVCWVSVCYF